MGVAIETGKWTLAELHRLPRHGNKYELVRGELFVTPPPSDAHETILARLTEILTPYVKSHGLGHVFHPRAVMRHAGSEVEPDLMVRQRHPDRRGDDSDWTRAPVPILVVEIVSSYTRSRDKRDKKDFYVDAGVDEYWIVDPEENTVTTIRSDGTENVVAEELKWSPAGAASSLTFAVDALFDSR